MEKMVLHIIFCLPLALFSQETEKTFSLFYENDQYELTTKHFKLIDSLNSLEDKSNYDIHIKGYTNNLGSELYNLELSKKRAENVKKELRKFTIISSTGYGELNSEAADNRRVDILIHRKEFHVPVEGEIIEPPLHETERLPSMASLKAPKIGDKIILEGIRFYTDRDVIMDESKEALEELIDFLNRNPTVRFKLLGHICCGDEENPYRDLTNVRTGKDNLSEARARAVYNYLVKRGIEKKRMRYVGMAYRNPTHKGDEFDRRVEIEITSVD